MLSRTLEKLFRSSRALDTEGLCIVAGQLVWAINVEVHAINDDGNLIDCACMAVISALVHYRRPDVTVTGEEVVIVRGLCVVLHVTRAHSARSIFLYHHSHTFYSAPNRPKEPGPTEHPPHATVRFFRSIWHGVSAVQISMLNKETNEA